jgi:hypothetical protein
MDGDIMVVRASGSGSCVRALCAYGRYDEVIPLQRQQLLDRTAKEGHLHEDTVTQHLINEGYDVAGSQRIITLPVIRERVEIRGHLDGIYSGKGVVEIKSMSKSRFDDWQRHGLSAFPKYQWQLSSYMYALADELGIDPAPALYAVKRRDDGLIDVKEIDHPPIRFQDIRKKMVQVLQHRKAGTLPGCDVSRSEQFWCPFPFLHEEDVVDMDLPDEKILALEELVAQYDEQREIENRGKEAADKKRTIGQEMLNLMDGRDAAEVAGYKITRVKQTRESVDLAVLKADLDPAELAKYQKVSHIEYAKVTKRSK